MELCRGGCLQDKLDGGGYVSEPDIKDWMRQLFMALSACHAVGIVHRSRLPSLEPAAFPSAPFPPRSPVNLPPDPHPRRRRRRPPRPPAISRLQGHQIGEPDAAVRAAGVATGPHRLWPREAHDQGGPRHVARPVAFRQGTCDACDAMRAMRACVRACMRACAAPSRVPLTSPAAAAAARRPHLRASHPPSRH